MILITTLEFRAWAGASVPANVPDNLIEDCIREAEAALGAEVGQHVLVIANHVDARSIAKGDVMRRTSRLLARRNSPEGVQGIGTDLTFQVPSRDPDSAACIRQIRALLLLPEGVA